MRAIACILLLLLIGPSWKMVRSQSFVIEKHQNGSSMQGTVLMHGDKIGALLFFPDFASPGSNISSDSLIGITLSFSAHEKDSLALAMEYRDYYHVASAHLILPDTLLDKVIGTKTFTSLPIPPGVKTVFNQKDGLKLIPVLRGPFRKYALELSVHPINLWQD